MERMKGSIFRWQADKTHRSTEETFGFGTDQDEIEVRGGARAGEVCVCACVCGGGAADIDQILRNNHQNNQTSTHFISPFLIFWRAHNTVVNTW